MVSFFGMSDKVGNISFYDSSGQSDFGFTKPYSEKTSELIDQEVKQIIEESYVRAQDVLKKHIKGLIELAELLLEKEVIFSEDLERIFGKRQADILKEERESVVKNGLSLKSGKETVAAIGPAVTQAEESVKTSGKEKKTSDKSAKKSKGEKAKSKK
jgi:cell division protease FtsH